jgi:DNA-binding transcriptional regulator YhcF (GntR family)
MPAAQPRSSSQRTATVPLPTPSGSRSMRHAPVSKIALGGSEMKRTKFGLVPADAAANSALGALAQVYIAIVSYGDSEGQAFPSIPTLAAKTGLHERTVQRAIAGLMAEGLIEKKARTAAAGDQDTNMYTICRSEGVMATDATRVVATDATRVVAQRATQTDSLNRPINKARGPARGEPRRPLEAEHTAKDDCTTTLTSDERHHQHRLALYAKTGRWHRIWGDPPPGVADVAA